MDHPKPTRNRSSSSLSGSRKPSLTSSLPLSAPQRSRQPGKPVIPKKPGRYVNGRIVYIPDSVDRAQESSASSCNLLSGESDSESDVDTKVNVKVTSITNEGIHFIHLVLKALSNLMGFKAAFMDRFHDNKEVHPFLVSVFRDVEPLKIMYGIMVEKLGSLQKKADGTGFQLPDLFLDKEVRGSLNIYKTFLGQYAINAKWIGEFIRSNAACREVCAQAKHKMGLEDALVTPESCLYTIFNSLFSYELLMTRISKCFVEGSDTRIKAEEVKMLISGILNTINTNMDKANFLQTHKELNLITGRSRDTKITTAFICKGEAIKLSRRDDKALQRQLVLFSDCLFVTLIPNSFNGTSSVRQELSLRAMTITPITGGESMSDRATTTLKWGLNISAREAQQDFYFEDEATLNMWIDKITQAIKQEASTNPDADKTSDSSKLTIGEEAPKWQKDNMAQTCNGLSCSVRFSHTARRHHCRSCGLLYCDVCCSRKSSLKFERSAESRVCELCYRISLDARFISNDERAEAKRQLEQVFERKTRRGRMTGWLSEQSYSTDRGGFLNSVRFFCELDLRDPVLNLYECLEDKFRHHMIMLLGMVVRVQKESSLHRKLNGNQFIVEHQDKPSETFLFTADNTEIANEWVRWLRESIKNY